MRKERGVLVIWLVFVLLLGVIVGIGFDYFSNARVAGEKPMPANSPRQLEDIENLFVRIAEEAKPFVVQIITTRVTRAVTDPFEEFERFFRPFEEMFPEFFRPFRGPFRREPRAPRRQGLGSGFIINEKGYIITNYHVVRDVDEIKVRLYGHDEEISATVVGTDPLTDLAMIKIEFPQKLPVARLGDSDRIRVGEWAIAVGNPFGLEHTVTVGIISGKGRAGLGMTHFEDFIQTDAPIHPGSSGGPLLNSAGEVIGVNTFIMTRGVGMPMVFGFAIPINVVKDIYPQLRDEGEVRRGWLGVVIQPLTEKLVDVLGLPDSRGVLISEVMPEGPAAGAGLRAGDVIREFEGEEILCVRDLQYKVAHAGPARIVTIKIIRDGKDKKIAVTLGEMPAAEELARIREEGVIEGRLGFEVREVDRRGVVVVEVDPDGPSANIIKVGDVIKEINRISITNLRDYKRAVRGIKSGDGVLLRIRRGERSLFLAIEAK